MTEPLIDDSEADTQAAVKFIIDALMDGDTIRVNPFFGLSVQSFWLPDGELVEHGVEIDADEFAALIIGSDGHGEDALEFIRGRTRAAMRGWLLDTDLGKTVIDTRLAKMAEERKEAAEVTP